MTAKLSIRNLAKKFGDQTVLKDLSLVVNEGEFLTLLGPSGCGKSTLLAAIAGFERPDQGTIALDGRDLVHLPPHRRGIGYVPQDYALFSHLDVRRNLAFGVKRGDPAASRHLDELIDRLDLRLLLDRKPGELNMSEMQRVALGRALAAQPSFILLDEPMSNLDAALRARLRTELRELQRRFRQTVIYVTHDQVEAMAMSDRIMVMQDGRIIQDGKPLDLYARPVNRYVAGFIGEPEMNFLLATVKDRAGGRVATLGDLVLAELPGSIPPGRAELGIRPHHVHLSAEGHGVPGEITDIEHLGHAHLATVTIGGIAIRALLARNLLSTGARVLVTLDPSHLHVFDLSGELLVHGREKRERAA